MGRRGCMRNLGRNSRSRGQHLRDSVHAGGNPSLTNPLPVQGIHLFRTFYLFVTYSLKKVRESKKLYKSIKK